MIFLLLQDTIDKNLTIFVGGATLNLARFSSVFVMHLYLYPEVKQALDMLQYVVYKPETFAQGKVFFVSLICIFKFAGALSCQLFSMYFMMTFTTTYKVIVSYVSFTIIARIDNIMAGTLAHLGIGANMLAHPVMTEFANTTASDDFALVSKWKQEGKMNWMKWTGMTMIMVFHRVVRFIYSVCYFYFTPVLVVTIVEMYDAFYVHKIL
jgi:hypothetical protein